MLKYLILLLVSFSAYSQNTRVPNFRDAKKILKKTEYFGIKNEIYCNCPIKPGNKFDASSCGYTPKKQNSRAQRLEAEHVVPYSSIIAGTKQYREGAPECKGKKGRACASIVFGYVEGDLWNLMPSIGELNGLRSNYSPAEIPGEERAFGKCDFEVVDRKVEPPTDIKPLMAATYYYMQEAYGKTYGINLISGRNEKLLKAWYSQPMPRWVCDWSKRVLAAQGNDNKFISSKCQ